MNNTQTIQPTIRTNPVERTREYTYRHPDAGTERTDNYDETFAPIVSVYVRHDKTRQRYVASASRAWQGERVTRRVIDYATPPVSGVFESAPRYNAKRFNDFADYARKHFEAGMPELLAWAAEGDM